MGPGPHPPLVPCGSLSIFWANLLIICQAAGFLQGYDYPVHRGLGPPLFCFIGWVYGIMNEAEFVSKDVLDYDVCIIGGEAAGTYVAIRLRDMNMIVTAIEVKDKLCGDTETYTDPVF